MTVYYQYRPRITRREVREVALTPRRAEVLDGLCDGLMNTQIAARLVCTEDTVKSHVKHLLEVTGCTRRHELVAMVLTGRVHVLVRDPRGVRRG